MRPITVTKTLTAASANAIALSQTPVSGTALNLNGASVTAGVATLDSQRRIALAYGNEAAPRTLTLTGTNDAGATLTEILSIPSGAPGTVATLQDFLTITRALPLGGGWTAAVTLGTSSIGATQWFIPDIDIAPFSIAIGTVIVSGTPTWSIELPYEDPRAAIPDVGIDAAAPDPSEHLPARRHHRRHRQRHGLDLPRARVRLAARCDRAGERARHRHAGRVDRAVITITCVLTEGHT